MVDRLNISERLRSLPRPHGRSAGTLLGMAALILAVVVLYYPVGMLMVHQISDDTEIVVEPPRGGSEAVAMAVHLIRHETVENRWTPMDPFFLPSAALDNMPNFQVGVRDAISRFTIELTDQIGRIRGSSQADTDLERATGFLKYAPDVWFYNISESLLPQRSSSEQYQNGADALEEFNKRLSEGNAIFDKRADNLLATMERFSADLGSASAVLDAGIADLSTLSTDADDIFYHTKGRLYGYYMLLRAFESDFGKIIAEKELVTLWQAMLASLKSAAEMDPLVVLNGAPDATILPSHLASQGFYLLRARTQIKEIINVLLK